jgi:hypothetical protein
MNVTLLEGGRQMIEIKRHRTFLLAGFLLAMSVPLRLEAVLGADHSTHKNDKQKFELKASKTEAAATTKETVRKTSDKRKEVVEEAVSSLREAQDALKFLDQDKTKEALASLEQATGKLDIVLARDPHASLIPIDVQVRTHDLYSSLEAINSAKQEAQRLLADGQVQQARAILANLGSETIISTTNLPVASYPAALKSAAKLVDENKVNEAKEVLQTAFNTLVVSDVIIPLPVVHAQLSLEKADRLAKAKDRTTEQNKQLTELLTTADSEIKFAEALGYGRKSDFGSFHKQIEEIRQKTSGGKSGVGFFDQIKTYMEAMSNSSQHKPSEKK